MIEGKSMKQSARFAGPWELERSDNGQYWLRSSEPYSSTGARYIGSIGSNIQGAETREAVEPIAQLIVHAPQLADALVRSTEAIDLLIRAIGWEQLRESITDLSDVDRLSECMKQNAELLNAVCK